MDFLSGRSVHHAFLRHAGAMLPWRRFAIETAWAPAVLSTELGSLVEQGRMGSGWQLVVHEGVFHMKHQAVRLGRAQTIVVVHARVAPAAAGSHLVVTVRSPLSAIVFFAYFAVSALGGGLAACGAALTRGDLGSLVVCVLFACAMPLFAWGIVAYQLVPEVRAAENALRSALPPPAAENGPFR